MGLLSRPSSYFPLPHERQPLPPINTQLRPEPSRRGSKEPNPQALTSSTHSIGSGGPIPPPGSLTPFIESYVQRDQKDGAGSSTLPPLDLPGSLTSEDFTRAVTAATVTALRHQQTLNSAQKPRPASGPVAKAIEEEEEHGGHDGPSWSRFVSATVLLSCTVLYAIIAGSSELSCSFLSSLRLTRTPLSSLLQRSSSMSSTSFSRDRESTKSSSESRSSLSSQTPPSS